MTTLQASQGNLVTEELGVLLQCPRCGSGMTTLCARCGFCMDLKDGIWDALPREREMHFTRFVKDYEQIRDAEGRGCNSAAFYLALPYHDRTGKNAEQWRIRARSYNFLLHHILKPVFSSIPGKILDIGAGNGWMSFRLASEGYRPLAVDLLTNAQDGLGAAEHYRKCLPKLFPRFRAEMEHLPFQDHQVDAAIFNASFHYSENYEHTLREALRCVTPEGLIIICDTPWYSCEASGQQMLSERRAGFRTKYGTASDSLKSEEFLTPSRLRALEQKLSIRITMYSPYYGMRWAMRPIVAWLRSRRRPSQFRIYVVRKNT